MPNVSAALMMSVWGPMERFVAWNVPLEQSTPGLASSVHVYGPDVASLGWKTKAAVCWVVGLAGFWSKIISGPLDLATLQLTPALTHVVVRLAMVAGSQAFMKSACAV